MLDVLCMCAGPGHHRWHDRPRHGGSVCREPQSRTFLGFSAVSREEGEEGREGCRKGMCVCVKACMRQEVSARGLWKKQQLSAMLSSACALVQGGLSSKVGWLVLFRKLEELHEGLAGTGS